MHTVDSNDRSGLFIGTVFVCGIDSNEWHTTLKVNERDITFKLDTGADANVLPHDVYQQVLSDVPMAQTDTILTVFGNSKIRREGEVKLEVKCQETSMTKLLSFYVTNASDIAILGCKASTSMNLVKRVAIDSVSNTTVLTKDSFLYIYGDVFTGIGEYKKPCHIEMDSSVPPVIQHCRNVPYARYDNLKQTLSDLEEKVTLRRRALSQVSTNQPTGFTTWSSPRSAMAGCECALTRSHSTRQLNASGMKYLPHQMYRAD